MSEWDFLWGLGGQKLIDAMTSGGAYDDWAYIERKEREQYGFDDDDSLDEQEFYTFWKLVKNRRGSKDNLICMRTDLNRNLWQQEGILIPKT